MKSDMSKPAQSRTNLEIESSSEYSFAEALMIWYSECHALALGAKLSKWTTIDIKEAPDTVLEHPFEAIVVDGNRDHRVVGIYLDPRRPRKFSLEEFSDFCLSRGICPCLIESQESYSPNYFALKFVESIPGVPPIMFDTLRCPSCDGPLTLRNPTEQEEHTLSIPWFVCASKGDQGMQDDAQCAEIRIGLERFYTVLTRICDSIYRTRDSIFQGLAEMATRPLLYANLDVIRREVLRASKGQSRRLH